MKNINLFKYVGTNAFKRFLSAYGYKPEDVEGFSLSEQKQCRGNILKTYEVCFKDGEKEYFNVAVFESFNEYRQSALGFNGNKLLSWYEDANIRMYK